MRRDGATRPRYFSCIHSITNRTVSIFLATPDLEDRAEDGSPSLDGSISQERYVDSKEQAADTSASPMLQRKERRGEPASSSASASSLFDEQALPREHGII